MPIVTDRPTETTVAVRGRRRRPAIRRRYRAALALLTLLAVLGKAVLADTQAIQAVLEMWRHLQRIGF